MRSKKNTSMLKRLLTGFCSVAVCSVFLFGGCCVWKKIKYPETLEGIKIEKKAFAASYNRALSPREKEKVFNDIRVYLERVMSKKVLPAWYGTPWSFNGDAENPWDGTVACGFFVVNVLRNCHFNIQAKMAMQPSENIIKNLVQSENIRRFSRISIHTLKDRIKQMGDGIYIIGLDTHVGFILNLNGKIRFTHAHGYLFVLSEYPNFSPTLLRSDYIVLGKLFDDKMIEKWLLDQDFPATYDYFDKKENV